MIVALDAYIAIFAMNHTIPSYDFANFAVEFPKFIRLLKIHCFFVSKWLIEFDYSWSRYTGVYDVN